MSRSCNKGFSKTYMLLKPEEVGFLDLIHILYSRNINDRKFVDAPSETDESFERRWLIFLSIIVQKILMLVAKPIYGFGSKVEYWLNLVHANRNLGVLLFNSFRGNVIWPEKTSATFLSFIGHVDKRVELESSIKPGDVRYLPALTMMASKAAYENQLYLESTLRDHWKMEFIGYFDYYNDYQQKSTTQAFLFFDKSEPQPTIVVTFRGTEPFDSDAWCSDFDLSWYELQGIGKIHGGFMKALGLQKCSGWPEPEEMKARQEKFAYYEIRKMLITLLKENAGAKFVVTGHSQGGALAILFPLVLALHEDNWLLERLEGVYTYGQPRVGNENFGRFMNKKFKELKIKYYRFVYSNDMVPRLPFDNSDLMFKHFGTCVFINSFYEGQIVEEEPNKNYFSLVGAIVMMINAVWEFIRSFIFVYIGGPEYKEGSLLKMFRVIGLLIPGVSAHSTQDYVNSTRLISPDLFQPNKKAQ